MSENFPYQSINISLLELNKGQLEGLPKNPRWIKDERYDALKKSIQDAPELLEARTLLVYPLDNGHFVVIGGNMRLRACKELGFKELPCYVFKRETPVEKLAEYTIKDNVAFGNIDWELIANEWDTELVQDWGLDCSFLNDGDDTNIDGLFEEKPQDAKEKDINITVVVPHEMEEQQEAIKAAITAALTEFENVKVK